MTRDLLILHKKCFFLTRDVKVNALLGIELSACTLVDMIPQTDYAGFPNRPEAITILREIWSFLCSLFLIIQLQIPRMIHGNIDSKRIGLDLLGQCPQTWNKAFNPSDIKPLFLGFHFG